MAYNPTPSNPYRWYKITKNIKVKGIPTTLFYVMVHQVNMKFVQYYTDPNNTIVDEDGNVVNVPFLLNTRPVKANVSFKVFNAQQDALDDFRGNCIDDFNYSFYWDSMSYVNADVKAFLLDKYQVGSIVE